MLQKRANHNIDLSPILPEAQSIVRAATLVYLQHLSPWCIGVIIHGSALKGGYIPGCSDIDFQIYLEPEAFQGNSDLPLDLAIALHRDLARIDPAPFQYIQGYALPPQKRTGMTGLIPGAYHIITGTLPVPEATEEELQIAARQALENLNVANLFHPQELLQHGAWKLAQQVRWLCTDVWPMLYHVLTVQQGQGIAMWQLPKHEAMKMLPQESSLAPTLHTFYQAICSYYPAETSTEDALKAIQSGLVFLQSVKYWWIENNT
jgi:hypothetical protein